MQDEVRIFLSGPARADAAVSLWLARAPSSLARALINGARQRLLWTGWPGPQKPPEMRAGRQLSCPITSTRWPRHTCQSRGPGGHYSQQGSVPLFLDGQPHAFAKNSSRGATFFEERKLAKLSDYIYQRGQSNRIKWPPRKDVLGWAGRNICALSFPLSLFLSLLPLFVRLSFSLSVYQSVPPSFLPSHLSLPLSFSISPSFNAGTHLESFHLIDSR